MNVIRTIKTAATVAAILLLAGCILEPQDDSGSISFSVSAPEAAVSGNSITIDGDTDVDPDSAAVTHARIWMYTNGSEYRLAPTSARAPSSRNYVEADISSGRATVKIEGIPAGRGYSAVIIMGTKPDDVFVPVAYARTGRFAINAGRETSVAPDKVALAGDEDSVLSSVDYNLIGTNLNSVVAVGGDVFTDDGNPDLSDEDETAHSVYSRNGGFNRVGGAGDFGQIGGLSSGTIGEESVWFINSSNGIFQNGESAPITPSNITDVTFSGTFSVEGSDQTGGEDVVFYQRLGGLGGVAGTEISRNSEWEDFGDEELNSDDLRVVDPDTSPVRAQASSGNRGFFSTRAIGNFMVTEALFDSNNDFSQDELLSGDADGITFFNVAYPGTSSPLRLNHMAVVSAGGSGDQLVVGTPRGAYAFPPSLIGGEGDVELFRTLVEDENVLALTATSGYLAVATSETVSLFDFSDGIPSSIETAEVFELPRRAVALGNPAGLAIEIDGGSPVLHVAGTEGMTSVSAR